jgi:DNA mismatch endonuclease (patch repair protein)
MIAVFVDWDYWHGWLFPRWVEKLSPYWRGKIEGNRRRDYANRQRLSRAGWTVVRIWEHEIESDLDRCANRIEALIKAYFLGGRNDAGIQPEAGQLLRLQCDTLAHHIA